MSMREQVITAAEAVIREQGLTRCTTKEIAETARCSEGTIYRHFRSKEDLFLAVLTERLPGLVPALRSLPETVGSRDEVHATLLRVAEEALAFYRASMPMLLPAFAEPKLLESHRRWMRENNAGPHRAVELLTGYLRAAQSAGLLSESADPAAAAGMLLGACHLTAYGEMFTGEGAGPEAGEGHIFVQGVWLMLQRPAAVAD
ncbi:TetR/AcrR family transcriptional regulator [Streptomyces sp. NPDC049954]|uniref:TetR/AcrR family transcriptional regulator n=1 Tax=Streptomyces sp. NPDC049954 TaxID=3155779 RepID=UPI0034391D71